MRRLDVADFMQYIKPELAPAVKARQDLERRITDEVVKALIGRDFVIRVYDGEDWACKRTTDPELIQRSIMATDEDYLILFKANEKERFGFVYLVYGNSGHDVVSDFSDVLGPIIDPIIAKYN